MKVFISAILILVVMFAGSGFYVYNLDHKIEYLDEQIGYLETAVHDEDWEKSHNVQEKLMREWTKAEKQFKTFIEHYDTDEIYRVLHEIKGYVAFHDKEKALVKIGVLHILLNRIPENERLTLANIL